MQQRILLAALAAAVLSACGGGGDSAPAAGPPATPSAITLSGTAATGAAIVGGQVDVKCAAGTGSATTIADGSYTVTISGASLPCVLRVTTGSAELYSVADNGSGAAVRANITPFTHLLAAQIVGGNLANVYANFDISAQQKLTSTAVASAISAVTAALSGTVDFGGVNPITGTFVIGDAFDQQLDAFKLALDQAQTTLDEVTNVIVDGGAAPAQTILQPASTACAGLRSGKYRVINPHEVGHDAAYVTHLVTVNAAALTVTDDLDTTQTPNALTPDASSACRFTLPGDFGPATLLVAPSGVSVLRAPVSATQAVASFLIPEQAIAVSELAGNFNYLEYRRDTLNEPLAPLSGTATIDAAGNLTAGTDCTGLATCTDWVAPFGALAVNAVGGFDLDGGISRIFAFKGTNGAISLFGIDTQTGGIFFASRQAVLSLPAVGAVSTSWDFSLGGAGFASALTESTLTITAVDTAAQSLTRLRSSDGRVDSFTINQPRNGLRYRAAGTSPNNTGGTVTLQELINLPLPGTGLGVSASVAANQNFFNISVNKP